MSKVKMFFGNQYKTINLDSPMDQAKVMLKKCLIVSASVCALMWIIVGVAPYFSKESVVYAEKKVEVAVEVPTPILDKIMYCESGGKQLDRNGQVLMKSNTNGSVDVGAMQINISIWGQRATKMGYDLTKESDNKAFGRYLFANYGSEPWFLSKGCWSK